jgi:hypothetical protein
MNDARRREGVARLRLTACDRAACDEGHDDERNPISAPADEPTMT